MATRLELHEILKGILGSSNVYYQPPSNIKMKYPCIVYSKSRQDVRYADGHRYSLKNVYSVTVVDKDPDSLIPARLANLPYCSFDRTYASENLKHFVYTIYY